MIKTLNKLGTEEQSYIQNTTKHRKYHLENIKNKSMPLRPQKQNKNVITLI